jgi:ornithine decarboxylase
MWGDAVLQYFLALEEGINRMPGFSPELQGVYIIKGEDGRKRAWGYVLNDEALSKYQK